MPRKSIAPRTLATLAAPFRRKLLAWYARSARDLPWRRTRDPYQVLVSEVMLQQTQVSRVAEYYPRFLERFPDLGTLAAARPRAVREAWDGLGYYARARNLHEWRDCAEMTLPKRAAYRIQRWQVAEDSRGADRAAGRRTLHSRRSRSLAYEKPVPAVDTNVRDRVIRRTPLPQRRATRQRAT